jgi:hypothetical protein
VVTGLTGAICMTFHPPHTSFGRACRVLAAGLATFGLARPSLGQDESDPTAEPPPISIEEFHYGVAVAFESLISGGDVCPNQAAAPCILGSGGGLVIRFGYRTTGPWLFAAAYEFSRQDASNLLRLPILQQLRAEARHYFDYGQRLTPYAVGSLGAMVYGNEWRAESGGAVGGLGGGIEFELSRVAVVGISLIYRPLLFRRWTDSAGVVRADRYLGFGLAHLLGIELNLALRDPLPRW